jgi:hypothetical protein
VFRFYRPLVEVLEGRTVPSFMTAASYAVGSNPRSVAVGDFNGDGIPDLVVANYLSLPGTVSVLLGNGDGTFQPARSFGVGVEQPWTVAVGDFNGDGNLDIVTGNGATYGLSVLLGNGNGTFQPARIYEYAPGGRRDVPYSLAVGDFNGDGKQDLAGAGSRGVVGVLLGNGNGTFDAGQAYDTGSDGCLSVSVGDFRGNGHLDLVAANYGNTVSVLLGNGDGTFQAAQNYVVGSNQFFIASVAVGDFNGDGALDIAVADAARSDSTVSILLGNGDGSFQPAQSYAVPGAVGLAVGDFDGDGVADLAVISSNSVMVLRGNGDGTFQAGGTYAVGNNPDYVAVGDFNGDGWPDLAVTNLQSNTVSVLLNAADTPARIRVSSPSSVQAGAPFNLTVTAEDAYGHRAYGYRGTVHFTSTDGGASLPADYTFTAADQGAHTFAGGAILQTAGNQNIGATDTGTGSITGSGTVAVSPAAADHILITGPDHASAGTPFDIVVTIQDQYGNTVTDYTGTVHFMTDDPDGTLPDDYTFTVADAGSHVFSGGITLYADGSQIVVADTEVDTLTGSLVITFG